MIMKKKKSLSKKKSEKNKRMNPVKKGKGTQKFRKDCLSKEVIRRIRRQVIIDYLEVTKYRRR